MAEETEVLVGGILCQITQPAHADSVIFVLHGRMGKPML